MKKCSLLLSDFLLGAACATAFILSHVWFLVFFIPMAWWGTLRHRSNTHRTLGTLLWGTGFYFTGMFWIIYVLRTFGEMPYPVCLAALLVLSVYLSLYFTLGVWLSGMISRDHFLFYLPLTYYLTEQLRGWVFGGFPWNGWGQPLAGTVFSHGAAIVGLPGLSSVVLAVTTLPWLRGWRRWVSCGVCLMILAGGILSRSVLTPDGESLRSVVVQPNLDEKSRYFGADIAGWSSSRKLAEPFFAGGAEVVVFPESAFLEPLSSRDDVVRTCRKWSSRGTDVLINANTVDARGRWYNSAVLFHQDHPLSLYHKVHLVPFGEYLPFRSRFEALGFKRIARSLSDFTAGNEPVNLKGRCEYGVSICYEIVFSRLVRSQVTRGADLLVTMTNDGWYGGMGADHQHFAQAAFRSVEFHRPLLRSALTGISGIVSGRGDIVTLLPANERGAVMEEVSLSSHNTVYYYVQPYLPWIVLLILLIAYWKEHSHGRHSRTSRTD